MVRDQSMVAQGSRLRLAREHAGYKSGRMAALRLGWKYPTYAAHESGGRAITFGASKKYARAFGVASEFIMYGTQAPDWYDEPEEKMVEVRTPVRHIRLFTGGAQASDISELVSSRSPLGGNFVVADHRGAMPVRIYAIEVDTDAMSSRAIHGDVPIEVGDILVVNAGAEEPRPGSIVVLGVEGSDAVYIRKARLKAAGKFEYVALNPDHPVVDGDDATLLGVAFMHIRNIR